MSLTNREASAAAAHVGFGPFVPPAPSGPTGPSHPVAVAGMWMALDSIMNNVDSINGLEMSWNSVTVAWGSRVSAMTSAENTTLYNDYVNLTNTVNGDSGADNYSELVTKAQFQYQNDQTEAQNNLQNPQAQLDKETQTAKDLGTVTSQGLQNAQSILGIASNLAQQMAK